jgi:ATP-dependent exoDNAse (exonuclease V) beta subunit
VTDYKSNWLGPDIQAYDTMAMEKSIIEHRYDLQYVLYLLALHRQLRARLPTTITTAMSAAPCSSSCEAPAAAATACITPSHRVS